jgi:hypothetical protein
METLILALLALLVLCGSVAGLLVFRPTAQGLRLLVVAPIPAALVVGLLATAYFFSYANNYGTIALFVLLSFLATWVSGFVLCAIAIFLAKRFRARHGEGHA